MNDDKYFIEYALNLAKLGELTTSPNPNVGCIIVKNKKIVGKGYHKIQGEQHAEILALNMAGNNAYGATMYVTLEPCNYHGHTPPCTDAIIKSGIKKVVSTIPDPNIKISGNGFLTLQKAGIEVVYGFLKKEAERINSGFFKRMRTGLPWIIIKLASSIDGRIAMKSGESKWITSIESRNDVQYLRAKSDAILSTSNTVLMDNPKFNVRWSNLNHEVKKNYNEEELHQPIRVIIDNNNLINYNHNVIKLPGKTWLIKSFLDKKTWPDNVSQIFIECNEFNKINLKSLISYLGSKNINNVLVESGSNLSGALLSENLVDEIILYIAPKILGSNTKSVFEIPNLLFLNQAINLEIMEIKKIGPDIRFILKPIK